MSTGTEFSPVNSEATSGSSNNNTNKRKTSYFGYPSDFDSSDDEAPGDEPTPRRPAELWEKTGRVPLDVYSVHYTHNFTLFNKHNISRVHDEWGGGAGGWLPGPDLADAQRFYEALLSAWGADAGMTRMHEIDFLVFLDYMTPAFQAEPEGGRARRPSRPWSMQRRRGTTHRMGR